MTNNSVVNSLIIVQYPKGGELTLRQKDLRSVQLNEDMSIFYRGDDYYGYLFIEPEDEQRVYNLLVKILRQPLNHDILIKACIRR